MGYKILNDKGDFLVQVQRGGLRRTRRGAGGEKEALRAEAELSAEIDATLKLEEARRLLGIVEPRSTAFVPPPTLREFFESRWVEHAKVVQNASTRRISRSPFNYLLYYLGDHRLDALLEPAQINGFIEKMSSNGPLSFVARQDGQLRRRQAEPLTNATINKSLQSLRALLYLAHSEKRIPMPPSIDLLPEDNSVTVHPPTEEQLQHLLAMCSKFREVAPLLPEVTEFAAETGLRRGEVFNLRFRSVDLPRAAIRVEMQLRGRVINGQAWRPKHNKWREVPLSSRAKAIIEQRAAAGTHQPEDLVFPNRGGAPYLRMDHAPDAAGKGFFPDAVEAAGFKGTVTFHSLRHLFAVRLLTRGVPITVVSELLGHSDINLTVKRYGRFASDAKVKWDAMKVLDMAQNGDERPMLWRPCPTGTPDR